MQTQIENMPKSERNILKNFKQALNIEVFHFPEYNGTVAIRRTGQNMGEFSVAICNQADKYKKKTGKYAALYRLYYGIKLPCRIADYRVIGTGSYGITEEDNLHAAAENLIIAIQG